MLHLGYGKQKSFRYIAAYSRICGHIQAYSSIFRHKKALFRHIQSSLLPWCIQNPGMVRVRAILRTLAYSEPWCIQSSDIFRDRSITEAYCIQNQSDTEDPGKFRNLVYSGHWHIQNRCGVLRNNAKIYFTQSLNSANQDLSATGRNNVKLVFNIRKRDPFHTKQVFSWKKPAYPENTVMWMTLDYYKEFQKSFSVFLRLHTCTRLCFVLKSN